MQNEVKYLVVRCVELARREKTVLVSYNGREMWFTLSMLKSFEKQPDGYTRMVVPDWMFRERIQRDIAKKKTWSVDKERAEFYRANRRKVEALRYTGVTEL